MAWFNSGPKRRLAGVWLEGVGEHAEAGNAHIDAVAGGEWADACRSPSQDQIAGLEGDGFRYVAEQGGDGEDEVKGRAVLAEVAVDAGFEVEAGFGVDFVADIGADGTEGVKTLGAGPLGFLLLQVAGGYVVGQGVAANHSSPVRIFGELGDALADDERQFTFEVYAG